MFEWRATMACRNVGESGVAHFRGADMGFRIVVFDSALNLAGWSGIVPAMPERGGPDAFVATDAGMLALWIHLPDGGGSFDLWATVFDETGEMVVPPHMVRASLVGAGCHDRISAAAVPASSVVAYVGGSGDSCELPEVRVLNTDRWGNPRSSPIALGLSALHVEELTVVADDGGWSAWAVTGSAGGGRRLEFQKLGLSAP